MARLSHHSSLCADIDTGNGFCIQEIGFHNKNFFFDYCYFPCSTGTPLYPIMKNVLRSLFVISLLRCLKRNITEKMILLRYNKIYLTEINSSLNSEIKFYF